MKPSPMIRRAGARFLVMLLALLVSAATVAQPPGALSQASTTPLNLQVADNHIIPSYADLVEATAALDEQAKAFCAGPDAAGLDGVRAAYHKAMDSWQLIQHIRFGPVEFLLRYNRFQMWPDKRGSVGKHLARLLAAADPEALDPERFAGASVAVQGFSALERLLFGPKVAIDSFGPAPGGRYRCAVVEAIGANLARMAKGLLEDWTRPDEGHRAYLATAADGNAFYDDEAEVASRLLNNLHTQLQVIVDQKLDLPLGEDIAKARGKRAESWRNARSLRNIRQNLEGCRALYRVGLAPRLADQALAHTTEQAFERTLWALDAIETSLFEAVSDTEKRPDVEELRATAADLKRLFAGPLPAALDIPLGFNSLDGD